MEINSGAKEKLVPGKWKNQGKKEAKKTADEHKKETGRQSCLMLPLQKEDDSGGKGGLDGGNQMTIKAKGFKSTEKIKQKKREIKSNAERQVITDGNVCDGGVKGKQKTPGDEEEDFKEGCRKGNAMGTEGGGLLLDRGKAGGKQGGKCRMHSHQGWQEIGKKERDGGKKEGCRCVGTQLCASGKGAGGTGQSTAKPRNDNDRKRKVPCIKKHILPDAQCLDSFQGLLDSSLEHCLEDAQMVLNEVQGLQAKVENSRDRAKESKKEKFPRERKEATVQTPKAKRKKENKEKREAYTEDESEHDDRWVQCNISSCKKWRKLDKHVDLSVLPPEWTCVQSSNPDCCNCNCPEENWSGSQDDLVYSSLVPGSLVWAQQQGYPWWPAMTERDPDSKSMFLFNNIDRSPSKYHVTFFGDPVTRAWVPSWKVKSFKTFSETTALKMGKSYEKKLFEAIRMAKQAQDLSLKSRLSRFGFRSRYTMDRGTSKEACEISEIMRIFEELEEYKQFSGNKGRIGKNRRNIKKKTSKEHATVPHGEPLEQGAGGGAEEGKEKAPISSVPRPDTDRKAPQTIFRDQTVPEIPVGGERREKKSQKLVNLDGDKAVKREVTEKRGAGSKVEEKHGGITSKKLCSRRVKLEESVEDLLQEDMEILSHQDIYSQLPGKAEKDEKFSFVFFEEE